MSKKKRKTAKKKKKKKVARRATRTARRSSTAKKSRVRSTRRREPAWARLPERELLDLRMCDLGLKIEGTKLEGRIGQIYQELERKGLRFRPHFWLSSEWFSPDGVPGVAIPFYLAHPRLIKLEGKQMLEVEGGDHRWCMKLLRHEVGHAIDNAYRLRRRRKWQRTFGKSSKRYPDYYQPRPFSRRFVIHLDYWYAQSHPTEDFAETFAVWLGQNSRWKKRYRGWPALRKLEYVDELMAEIAGTRPPVNNREREEPLRQIKTTLREHYEEKRRRYGVDYPDFYDKDLGRLFADARSCPRGERASTFLRRVRPEVRELVSNWTGQYQYTIDLVLREMIERSRTLKLRVDRPEQKVKLDVAVMVSVQTMNYLHGGHHRIAL